MIEWNPIETFAAAKRAPGEEFLFWQPPVNQGRTNLPGRIVVERFKPPGPRQTTWWARTNAPTHG